MGCAMKVLPEPPESEISEWASYLPGFMKGQGDVRKTEVIN